MNDIRISPDTFFKHHLILLNNLSKSQNQEVDVLCIISGKEENANKHKTKPLFIWYFGYDMIESILFITRKKIIFFASQKKISLLEEITQRKEAKQYNLQLIPKELTNNKDRIKNIFNELQAEIGKSILTLGMLLKEKQQGALALELDEVIKQSSMV